MRFVLATNQMAAAASIRLMRKEWKMQFMTKMAIARSITGAEQYIIRQRVCKIALF